MRDFILFVLDNGPLLFLGGASLALIFGVVFGAAVSGRRGRPATGPEKNRLAGSYVFVGRRPSGYDAVVQSHE